MRRYAPSRKMGHHLSAEHRAQLERLVRLRGITRACVLLGVQGAVIDKLLSSGSTTKTRDRVAAALELLEVPS